MTQITELIIELIQAYEQRIEELNAIISDLNVLITNEEDSAIRLAELRASKSQAMALRGACAGFINDLKKMTAS